MTRKEFIAQLARLLGDVEKQEREEAIDYYNSYFDDAGEENESQVIQELGSPGKVAAIIKADLADSRQEYGEYSETGYQDERFPERDQVPEAKDRTQNQEENQQRNQQENQQRNARAERQANRREQGYRVPKQKNTSNLILIVILLILTCPIWLGVGGGLLGLLVGAVGIIVAIIVGLGAGGIAMVLGGILCVIVGIVTLFSYLPGGIMMIALSCFLVVTGILCFLGFLWLTFQLIPRLLRWFVDFCQKLFSKGRGGRAV